MRQELLKLHVTQSDETPTQVINDGRSSGSKSYMWVHRSGKLYREQPVVIYEYQALQKIGLIYEGMLKEPSSKERLQQRELKVRPLVWDYFA